MSDLQAMMDRFAIRELIERYCNITNRRAWSEMPELFTEDVTWSVKGIPEFGPVTDFVGRDAFVAGVTGVVEQCSMLLHLTGACRVIVDGDTANSTCALQEVATFGDEGAGIYLVGVYYDRFRRTEEGWKFTRREFHPHFISRELPPYQIFPITDPEPA